jgi:hypothetical protein
VVQACYNRVSCWCYSSGFSFGLRSRSAAAFLEFWDQLVNFRADFWANLHSVGNAKLQLAVHDAFGASVRARAITAFEKVDSIFDSGPSSKQEIRHF